MQGHRNKKSKDMYLKLRTLLVDNKDVMCPKTPKGQESARAENMVNIFYTFASNRPRTFGIYSNMARDNVRELLALYEHDLLEAAQYLDGEYLTRLA
jgi:hypothetical protein